MHQVDGPVGTVETPITSTVPPLLNVARYWSPGGSAATVAPLLNDPRYLEHDRQPEPLRQPAEFLVKLRPVRLLLPLVD